ncbi:MAG TPA: hypothetical protein ENI38_03625 [Candidatus Acetothermia bacterium]|nr:hypothetical protein [Candidatus Acetothermia bacterium]
MIGVWLVLLGSALAILAAGQTLVRSAERIARATGLSQGWIGFILVAMVTSLPELVATMTGGGIDAPGIAVGNALGSNAFNLGILGLMGLLSGTAFFSRLSSSHVLSATGTVLLTAVVVGAVAMGGGISLGRVSLISCFLVGLYLVLVYVQFRAEEGTPPEPGLGLGTAPWLALLSAAVIVVAGVALTYAAKEVSLRTGISQSVVGSLLVALATSLPEVAASLGALRLRAYNLLAGDIFGSNMFNVVTVFFADLTLGRPILGALEADAWPLMLVAALGMGLSAVAVLGLMLSPKGGRSRSVDPASLVLTLSYLGGLGLLAVRGFVP